MAATVAALVEKGRKKDVEWSRRGERKMWYMWWLGCVDDKGTHW